MKHSDIIDALGGYRRVAAILKRDESRAFRWRADGIPRQHWPDLLDEARKASIPGITLDALRDGEPARASA